MRLYGPVREELRSLVNNCGLSEFVFFKGEVPQEELAKDLQQSDALVLYSRYETFGCVLIEANACGVPVIVSELAVFHELLQENINGVFVEGDRPDALAEAFSAFSQHKDSFNRLQISEKSRELYNYATVGKQFVLLYNKILDKT